VPYEGVLLCRPGNAVPLMEILRRATFKLSQVKAAGMDDEGRRARMFAMFATHKGRALLQRVRDE
jgi:hypothetical protein